VRGIDGVLDPILAHPLLLIGGLLLGGYLARSKFNFGAIWGGHAAEQSREKALKGTRGRRELRKYRKR
jgi:hypothetical protein